MPIFNVGGTNYPYPNVGDKPWGTIHIAWAAAVSNLATTTQTQVSTLIANQFLDPMLVDGDLIARIAGIADRLPIGAIGQVLTVGASLLPEWGTVLGTGDVVGPAGATNENLAVFDGVTGKLLKETTVNVSAAGDIVGINNMSVGGTLTALTPDVPTADAFWQAVSRPTGTSVTERGVAISAESGTVTETTTTPQDIGVNATIVTTGRPVFVGLTCDSSIGYFRASPDTASTSFYPFSVEVGIYRDGTLIYETRYAATATPTNTGGAAYPFDIPASAFWTIDIPTAASHIYTCRLNPSNSADSSEASCDNIKIVAFEL